jgi:glucose/arabinose dehydrogenase
MVGGLPPARCAGDTKLHNSNILSRKPAGPAWLCFLTATVLSAFAPAAWAALPPGFRSVPVITGLTEVMCIEFAPDGRMFVAERGGRVLLAENGTAKLVFHPPLDPTVGEGGLLGMALHPNFADNGWMYLCRTVRVDGVAYSRISRFTIDGDVGDPDSEIILWEVELLQTNGHFSGCLNFGPDGMLYATTGDQWHAEGAQGVTTPLGKLLRMNPVDGSAPADNPFAGQEGTAPLVWAYGLRNPFRFAFDRLTGEIYVGDVGYDTWEEVDRIVAGDNGGWPNMEGPECYADDCSEYRPPIWYYKHGDPNHGGASVIMGDVYRGEMFPKEYQGNIFVGDFSGNYIRRLILDDKGNVIDDPHFMDATAPTEMQVGPDGALYFTMYWGPQAGVHRIEYEDPNANKPPVAVASATPTSGVAPLEVQFSSEGSHDPDNGPSPLTYRWVFGDGTESTEPNPVHTYESRGEYRPRLTVSDGALLSSMELTVRVGEAPYASIMEPAPTLRFRGGQWITVRMRGYDPEDGSLPASAFSTRVVLVRMNGGFNVLAGPVDGQTEVTFQVPYTGRPLDDARIRIEVKVTDSDGLTELATRDIGPDLTTVVVETEPVDVPIFVNELPRDTPANVIGPIDYNYMIEAQESYTVNGEEYRFVEWSDGAPRVRTVIAPQNGAHLLAHYARANAPGDPGSPGNEQPDNKPPAGGTNNPPTGWLPCMVGPLALCAMGLLTRGSARRSGRKAA